MNCTSLKMMWDIHLVFYIKKKKMFFTSEDSSYNPFYPVVDDGVVGLTLTSICLNQQICLLLYRCSNTILIGV